MSLRPFKMITFKVILDCVHAYVSALFFCQLLIMEDFKCFCLASTTTNFLILFHQPPSKIFPKYFKAKSRYYIISPTNMSVFTSNKRFFKKQNHCSITKLNKLLNS